ncbi:uncharacterized protein SAPINGB_P005132 [Magnusiomyces paraingens]|uniref:Uncharacterized protein n=1 Tax=Magnusiomyces paraingens TaxID=2606893 RepID=A0A5E8C0W8_9ASCO|nr:uncharacterized protein SAPINGB_P005132 [Saprochaete ingens]VVT56525.1 unnamed protein product [Saprochaete ingens]
MGLFQKLSDPPFNATTLAKRLRASPLWALRQNADPRDIEPLLLDAIRACKALHRRTHNSHDQATTIHTTASKSHVTHDLRKAIGRSLKDVPTEPLNLLRAVLDRNVSVLTPKCVHAYLVTTPSPPTDHILALLRQYKSNAWVPPLIPLSKPLSQALVPPALRSSGTLIPQDQEIDADFVSLCWTAVRLAVYREQYDAAFAFVDIATRTGLVPDSSEAQTASVIYTHADGTVDTIPQREPSGLKKSKNSQMLDVQVNPKEQQRALRIQNLNLVSTQVCAASTTLFFSALAVTHYLATPLAPALTICAGLFPSFMYLTVPAFSGQRVKWTRMAFWQQVAPAVFMRTSFITGVINFCTSLVAAVRSPRTLVTNASAAGLDNSLARKLLELRMTDYIAVAYDELVDVTVDNFHVYGEKLSQPNVLTPETLYTHSYNYYHNDNNPTTTEEIASKTNQSSFESTKGPAVNHNAAKTVLQEQLARRRLRIKTSPSEQTFMDYWTFAGQGYEWVEPDQDPSGPAQARLRYDKKKV